jgi:hypothetical protein
MRAQTLHNLTEGNLRFGEFLRLVFVRVIIVTSLCLVVTLVIYLLSQGHFALGSFLAGAAFGLGAFLIWNGLKRHFVKQSGQELAAAADQKDSLAGPAEIRPKTSVPE